MSSGTISSSVSFTAVGGLNLAARVVAVALRVTRVDTGCVAAFLGIRLACAEPAFDALTADFSAAACAVLRDRSVRSTVRPAVADDEAGTETLPI